MVKFTQYTHILYTLNTYTDTCTYVTYVECTPEYAKLTAI